MKHITKISILIAVIGTVGVLHAMVDLLDTPGSTSTIQITEHNEGMREVSLTREVSPSSPSIDVSAPTTSPLPPQTINNIYNTQNGSFYFISIPVKPDANTSAEVEGTQSQTEPAPMYIQAANVDSHFDVSITGPIVRTKVTQRFKNTGAVWQDGVYVFPLPNGAAVDALLMRVGEREVIGEIQPKEKAKQMFDNAKAEGKRASLVQQVRPDIFKNQLSNIPPNEDIVIEIEYQQLLHHSDSGYELRLPTGIKQKYTPVAHQANDDSSANVLHPTQIEININMGLPIDNIESLHHSIVTQQINNVEYFLKTDRTALNDEMFVLRWSMQDKNHTQLNHIQEQSEEGTFGMISMLAPKQSEVQLKRDVTFVLDTSGSMVGEAITQAKAALTFAIQDLSYTDRFNIVEFNSRPLALWGASNTASDANKVTALDYLQQLEANGGTEMLSALDLAFELNNYRPEEEDRIRQLIFITDGSVSNETEILSKINASIDNTRLFTIGIGSAPNGYFMEEAAIAGKGLSLFIDNIKHVEQEMQRFLNKIKRPSWKDVSIKAAQSNSELSFFPRKLPDLYAGEPFFLFYQADPTLDVAQTDSLSVLAKSAVASQYGGVILEDITRQLSPSLVTDNVSISKQWASEKIQHLMRQLNTAPLTYESYAEDYAALESHVREKVTQLALAHSLVTQYTSLIAIDHSIEQASVLRLNDASKQAAAGMPFIDVQQLPSTSADVLSMRTMGILLTLLAFGLSLVMRYVLMPIRLADE